MAELSAERCIHCVSEILATLKSTNQHQKVLSLVIDRVMRVFPVQTCAVVLIDPRSEYLHVENSSGLSLTFCKGFKSRLATGAIGRLLWTGSPVFLSDAKAEPDLANEIMLERPFSSAVCLQIAIDNRTLGYLHLDSAQPEAFHQDDVPVLQCFADFIAVALCKAQLAEENMRLDTIDHETGVMKYSAIIERLDATMERAKDLNERFSILILDVDNFKDITHTYGYEASHMLLREMGDILKARLRPIDSVGRHGFDEFILLLPSTDLNRGAAEARVVSRLVREARFTKDRIETTVSLGVAGYPDCGREVREILLAAKSALFEAQRAGRDVVRIAPVVAPANVPTGG